MKKIEPWIRQRFKDLWTIGHPLYVMRHKKFYRLPWTMSWEELSVQTGVDIESLHRFNYKLINIKTLNKGTVIVIPGRALNVSYSEEGLKWTMNKLGKLLYFEDAFLIQSNGPKFQGKNLKKSKNVIIEEFVPRDHISNGKILIEDQKAEYLWTNKATRLLYDSGANLVPDDELAKSLKVEVIE